MFKLLILIGLGLLILYFRDRTIASRYSKTLTVRLLETHSIGSKLTAIAQALGDEAPDRIQIPFISPDRKVGEEVALLFNPRDPEKKLAPEHIEMLQEADRWIFLSSLALLALGTIGLSAWG